MTTATKPPQRTFTEADRQKAADSVRRQKAAAGKLRSNFLDRAEWDRLAKAAKVRMPAWTTPMSRPLLIRWIHRLGLSLTDYQVWSGFKQPEEFITANADWPLRAFVGLLLEFRELRKMASGAVKTAFASVLQG